MRFRTAVLLVLLIGTMQSAVASSGTVDLSAAPDIFGGETVVVYGDYGDQYRDLSESIQNELDAELAQDTGVTADVKENRSLILVGNPAVNQVTNDLAEDGDTYTMTDYRQDHIEGVIELVPNAFEDGQHVLVVAGDTDESLSHAVDQAVKLLNGGYGDIVENETLLQLSQAEYDDASDSDDEQDEESGDTDDNETEDTDDEQDDGDQEETDETTETEREVKIDAETDRVRIESSFETETGEQETEDEFELDFSVQMDPRIELKSETEQETAQTESENETGYKVRFRELIEFSDDNGNGVYDDGEAVSRYDLSDTAYTQVQHTTEERDGNTVHVIESTSTDDWFTVRLYAVGDITNIDGEQVVPTEVKIDLEVNDYQFNSDDTKLALHTAVSTEAEHELTQQDNDEETVIRSAGEQPAYFSWKNTAQVDGQETPVKSTRIADDEDEGEHDIYFTYNQGETIIHDPKIGIEDTSTDTGGGFLQTIISFFSSLFSF